MPTDIGSFVTIVAGSSVVAAAINQAVTAFRENRKTGKDASFSALYLAIALESYASDCATALGESESYEASDGHAGRGHGNVPELAAFPSTIEWKPLGIAKATQAMSFRVEVETARAMFRDLWDVTDEDYIVPLMREETTKLAQKALDLAVAFRREWKIAAVDYSGEWNVKTYLAEKTAKYAEQRKLRDERDRQLNEELSAIASEPRPETGGN